MNKLFNKKRAQILSEELQGQAGIGDVYTGTVIYANTKQILCWHVRTLLLSSN